MNVSVQLLISEMLEEIEVLCTQVTNSSIPAVRDSLDTISKEVDTLKRELEGPIPPKSLYSSDLSQRLEQISELNRARSNIDAVKQRL